MNVSYILGFICKVMFEVLLLLMILRYLLSVFLKRDNVMIKIFIFITEPILMLARGSVARIKKITRAPIDVGSCIGSIWIALLAFLFGIWF